MSTYCGFVAILGRPNVGKSTLLNCLIGQKISITAAKPQTTRHRILGVDTQDEHQIIYIDTPGIHLNAKKAMNRDLNRQARYAMRDIDAAVFVVEALRWTKEDALVAEDLQKYAGECPVICVINKVDKIKKKEDLLPFIQKIQSHGKFEAIVPISAMKRQHIEPLKAEIIKYIPESPHFFPKEQVTDKSERFLAAEVIREKLTRALSEELPYALTVEVESLKEAGQGYHIHAVIWVEKASQKGIVIGQQGQMLKEIGRLAREDLKKTYEKPVHLELWVKVREGWSDDEAALMNLGYLNLE